MPKQFILKPIFLTVFGFLTGYSMMSLINMNNINEQNENSFSSLAETTQFNKTLTKLSSDAIYQDYFDLRIKHEHISENNENTSTVKAIIKARKNLPPGLNYQWILGEGVSADAALLQGEVMALQANAEKEIELTVQGFSKKNQSYLSIEIQGTLDQNFLKKEVLTSSRPEDSFEYVVQQAYKKDLADQKKLGVSKMSSGTKNRFNPKNIIK